MLLVRGTEVIAAGLFNDVDGVDAGDHLTTSDNLLLPLLLLILLPLHLMSLLVIVCLVLLGGRPSGRLGWTAYGLLIVALGSEYGLEQLLGCSHEFVVMMGRRL